VTVVDLVTGVVVIVNVAPVLPPGTVTEAGTVAAVELSLNDTVTPPLGAGPLNVTVPWDDVPPVTLVGLTVNVLKAGGFTVSEAVLVSPP
jgi:hypothetical protein